ncbi:hypothetical protein L3X38_017373 [Prunus dulcis]|uniref:Retrotransposon gag domain-containing protein n=1 Tax=Prunus dulcis TaxID=3755 RepID=A0AAD4W9P1_PRUDU|nr:hypothetical protein L3X38_017373 [Prunus dulcis]
MRRKTPTCSIPRSQLMTTSYRGSLASSVHQHTAQAGQSSRSALKRQHGAHDWFHTLPSGSIRSFKELAFLFTKEYTSYRMIKKNPNYLFNLFKKHDESLGEYIKRLKAEKENIVGCDDRITALAFKKGLPVEHDLYR